jgi:D-alanyl-D-alanine carboxypeptidase
MISFANILKTTLSETIGQRGIASASISLLKRGSIEVCWVPKEIHHEPAFLTYSITKLFTATLIMILHEEGRLSIQDSIVRWYPNLHFSDQISIYQLMNHTSGLRDYGGLPEYQSAVRRSPSAPWTFKQYWDATIGKGLLFYPGKGWAYSNPGYMLLKDIIEKLTDESFAGLVSKRVAQPLGLSKTFVPETIQDLSSLSAAPSTALSHHKVLYNTPEVYHPGWVSHGVVASTPKEIVLFIQALFRHRLVSSHSIRKMTSLVSVPGARKPWREPGYGLGLMGDSKSKWGVLWGHSGEGPGYNTCMLHLPHVKEGPLSVCVMCAFEETSIAEQISFSIIDSVCQSITQ